jgi:hypothetical protein
MSRDAVRLGSSECERPLVGYALKELRQGFAVISRAVPRWKGLPVPDLFDAAVGNPITVLDFAIKLRYRRQFDDGYERLTAFSTTARWACVSSPVSIACV